MIKSPILNPRACKGSVNRDFHLGTANYDLDSAWSPDTGIDQSCVLDLASPKYEPNKTYVYDRSRYNNHGTITGATWATEKSGVKVNSFDGTDDVINCGSSATLDGLTGSLTMLAWINAVNLGESNAGVILRKGDFGTATGFFLSVVATQTIRAVVYVGAAAKIATAGDNGITFGKWALAVGVFDGTNVFTYVNTTAGAPTATGSATFDAHAASNLNVGNDTGGAYTFNGYIGLPRIFNRALSATEIAESNNRLRGLNN
jgi:hypothetical protein